MLRIRSRDEVISGVGRYREMFSAGSGNRYISGFKFGFKPLINVKRDGSGAVFLNASSGEIAMASLALDTSVHVHQSIQDACTPLMPELEVTGSQTS